MAERVSDSVESCPECESLQPRVDGVESKDKMHKNSRISLHGTADITKNNEWSRFPFLLAPSQLNKILSGKDVISNCTLKVKPMSFSSRFQSAKAPFTKLPAPSVQKLFRFIQLFFCIGIKPFLPQYFLRAVHKKIKCLIFVLLVFFVFLC